METTNLIIIGAGGHASVIVDIVKSIKNKNINIIGFLDDNESLSNFCGYKVLGKICDINKFSKDNQFIIAIGNNNIRKQISQKYNNINYVKLIHDSAVIGSNVTIGEGTVVMPRAVINSNSKIGSHTIINTGSIVEHDNIIGDFVHISPSATLCGGVNIGELSHIGANSTVIQYKKIEENVILGASSTVIEDIKSNCVAVGTPAKIIKSL